MSLPAADRSPTCVNGVAWDDEVASGVLAQQCDAGCVSALGRQPPEIPCLLAWVSAADDGFGSVHSSFARGFAAYIDRASLRFGPRAASALSLNDAD